MPVLFARAGISEMSPADARELGLTLLLFASIPVVVWFIFSVAVWGALFRRWLEIKRVGTAQWLVLALFLSPAVAWGFIFSSIVGGGPAALVFLFVAIVAARGGVFLFERFIMQGVYRCPRCETLLRQESDIHRCPGCGKSWTWDSKGSRWNMVVDLN